MTSETATLRSDDPYIQARRSRLQIMENIRRVFHKRKARDGQSQSADPLDETSVARSTLGILDCLPLEVRQMLYENVGSLNFNSWTSISCHGLLKLTEVFSSDIFSVLPSYISGNSQSPRRFWANTQHSSSVVGYIQRSIAVPLPILNLRVFLQEVFPISLLPKLDQL